MMLTEVGMKVILQIAITNEMKQSVIDHVNCSAPAELHHIRKQDHSLSFSKQFKLYIDWCTKNNCKRRVKTVRQYRDIVNAIMETDQLPPV